MPLPNEYDFINGFSLYEAGLEQSFGTAPSNNSTVTLGGVPYKYAGLATMRFTYSSYIRDAIWFALSADDGVSIPEKPFSQLIIADPTETFFYQIFNRQGDSLSSVDGPFPQLTDIGGTGQSKIQSSDTETSRSYRYWLWALDAHYSGTSNYATTSPSISNPNRDTHGLKIFRFSDAEGEEPKFYVE